MQLIKEYKSFEAQRYMDAMYALKSAKFNPLNTAEIMRLRVEAIEGGNKEVKAFFVDTPIDSTDGIVGHEGNLYIYYDVPNLIGITPNTSLIDGDLPFDPSEHSDLEHEVIPIAELEQNGINRHLKESEALEHPGWAALARGDRYLQKN